MMKDFTNIGNAQLQLIELNKKALNELLSNELVKDNAELREYVNNIMGGKLSKTPQEISKDISLICQQK